MTPVTEAVAVLATVREAARMEHIATLSVQVCAEFDDEAGVWVATSQDVPGLVTEHEHLQELIEQVISLIPILIVENGLVPELAHAKQVPVHIAAHALSRRNVLIPA